jgi:hypothetical protein
LIHFTRRKSHKRLCSAKKTTPPISWRFNDEHQMFAHLTRHNGIFGEMNVLDNLWMSRVTSHVSLRPALDQITPERIDAAITLADRTMRGAAFDAPRIAVAALNPRGGENGLFGRGRAGGPVIWISSIATICARSASNASRSAPITTCPMRLQFVAWTISRCRQVFRTTVRFAVHRMISTYSSSA